MPVGIILACVRAARTRKVLPRGREVHPLQGPLSNPPRICVPQVLEITAAGPKQVIKPALSRLRTRDLAAPVEIETLMPFSNRIAPQTIMPTQSLIIQVTQMKAALPERSESLGKRARTLQTSSHLPCL